jgi:uncharacterized membrane protein YdjX (TVP38/TMEM64 family)
MLGSLIALNGTLPFPIPMLCTTLYMGCGYIYGLGIGLVTCIFGCFFSVCGALLFRTYTRAWLQRAVAGSPRLRAVVFAIQSKGWRSIALLRMLPIPFGTVGSASALVTFLCVLFCVVLCCYLGVASALVTFSCVLCTLRTQISLSIVFIVRIIIIIKIISQSIFYSVSPEQRHCDHVSDCNVANSIGVCRRVPANAASARLDGFQRHAASRIS